MRRLILVAMAVATLTACGNNNNSSGDAAAPPTEEEVARAEAEEIYFDPALTRPRCPSRVNLAQYPGPELAGLRLGMSRDEALAAVYCERRDFHVETGAQYFNINTRGEQLGPQTIKVFDGVRRQCSMEESMDRISVGNCRRYGEWVVENTNQAFYIATPGRPGQERLLGIWRYQQFDENPPTIEATVASLVERFGQPGRVSDSNSSGEMTVADIASGRGDVQLRWGWDTSGAAMTGANPQMQRCSYNVGPYYGDSQSWSEECGLTVAARVSRRSDNAAIASSLSVGMVNQQVMYRSNDAMEQHYVQAEQAARQQETERARNADAPDL